MLRYLLHLFHLINRKYYKNKNWLQFLFIVKAAVLKQQISKFYPQILSTEDSFYIYERPLTEINVIAYTCIITCKVRNKEGLDSVHISSAERAISVGR